MTFNSFTSRTLRLVQTASISIYALSALTLITFTIGCAIGFTQWLALPVKIGETLYADAGMWIQVGLTLALSSLVFMIPTDNRILNL